MSTKAFLIGLILSATAAGQSFDASNNVALKGNYFFREILIAGEKSTGAITSASSSMGVIAFDGAGNYTFGSIAGKYAVGANGLLYIQSPTDPTQYAYGGISALGPSAFVASATEGTSADILVAIPAGASATVASLNGNYSAGYLSFPNFDVTMVRQAAITFTANGAGALSPVNVSGAAVNLGGANLKQTVTGATYTLAAGTGSLVFGTASTSQIVSGPTSFFMSADGNLFIGGTAGGVDLIVGMRALGASASNATWSGEYFTAGLEDTVNGSAHSIDAFYGSWNSNGQGISLAHDRYQGLLPQQQVFDYTFSSQSTVQASGAVSPADLPYDITLGNNGQSFIATGRSGLYSLMVGFGTPKFQGSGVFLNPLGVVNAANFAPITNPIAPNELITLFGSGLANGTVSASSLPLPTSLGNVQVTINNQAAPLFYVSPGQIAVLVPQGISPANQINNATIQVNNNGAKSNAVTVYTNYTSPGIFTASGNGIGAAAAQLGTNFSLITSSNPVPLNGTAVLYATGLGAVNPTVGDGAAAPSNPTAQTVDADDVFVGGQQESVLFNGLTPGLAGLYQLNTKILSGTPTGNDFSDLSTPDAYNSQATLSVTGTSGASFRLRQSSRQSSLPLRRVVR